MNYEITSPDSGTVWERIKSIYDSMYMAEKKVADFIMNDPSSALASNVSETAELSGVSDATVVRFCKRIGYSGFYQMKLQMSHDMGMNSASEPENNQEMPKSTAQEEMQIITDNIAKISQHINTDLLKKCARIIDNSEIVYVIGNGYTKILASDIIYRLTRMGIRCSGGGYAETDFENLYLGDEKDAAIFLSRSGEDKKTYKEMQLAQEKGMATISLTDAAKCPMAQLADYALTTGIEDRAKVFINEYSSSLNMMVLAEVLLRYVTERRETKDKKYLEDIIAEGRL